MVLRYYLAAGIRIPAAVTTKYRTGEGLPPAELRTAYNTRNNMFVVRLAAASLMLYNPVSRRGL